MSKINMSREIRITITYLIVLAVICILPNCMPAIKEMRSHENIYLVIKPRLTRQLLTEISERMEERNIYMSLNDLTYRDGRIEDIDVSIRIKVDKKETSYRIRQNQFNSLVFYYEGDPDHMGFGKDPVQGISEAGAGIVSEKLVGLMVQNDKSQTIVGSWESE